MSILQKSLAFPAMRISFALVLMTACILLTAEMLGFTCGWRILILTEISKS